MQRLGLYLFKQLFAAFALGTAAVVFVILFTQSFRILSLVIDNSSTLLVFFQLMGLTVPTLLPLVLPIGLGIAVLFVYNKLAVDSELVVMRASGMSPMRLALPGLALAGMVVAFCYVLTLWLAPLANRTLVAMQYEVRDGYAVFLSHPGNFNDITDGLTFYARRRDSNGALEGILIHDVRKPETPVTIMADTGRVIERDGQPQIVVFNGRRQEMEKSTGRLTELAFDQYVLDIAAMRSSTNKRLPDPREQTIVELLSPSDEMLHSRATHSALMAELNQRFASPLLALAFTFIGLSVILAGEFNRRGMGKRLTLAGLLLVSIEALFMSCNSISARHLWLAPVLYFVALLPMAIGFIAINMEQWRGRSTLSTLFKAGAR